MNFNLKACCKDCPFIKGTPMVLAPGRMEGIAKSLKNDYNVFPCHKTTHNLAPPSQDEDDGEGYDWHGREQACMGALAFSFQQTGRLPVLARLALASGELALETLEAQADKITPPGEWETR